MQTQKPKLTTSEEDGRLIAAIVERARTSGSGQRAAAFSPLDLTMDLCATHNTTPLRLADLLAARDSDFLHDVHGIQRHLDRRTGELTDHFLPRFTE